MVRSRNEGLEHLLHHGQASDGQRALRRSVVGNVARNRLGLHGLALKLPVVLRQLERGFDGLATTGREEHAVQVAGCIRCEAVSQFDRGGVCVTPDWEERQFASLLRCNLGEFFAPVAGVDNEQTRKSVDVLLARDVKDVVTLTLGDDRHPVTGFHAGLAGKVHPKVILGQPLKAGFFTAEFGGCFRHDYLLLFEGNP